ncbi:tRNA (adenosine(37)-N6)-dimethylallyltransferase MiaA [Brevundimonas sp. SORGH_AS_0993]|uniref:tRNA (adenosine(37)-N6)-dimethylallyltransferase MiaA n=1 Tax=Brevundimonas sp. SORGH_AS_0993 TaxID=3041794 RepID=UPI0027809E52|nr:tRNA (adenosine(37)-N6)-dimethylallyltransferase MiaA [Brevundimonas sp. SORGH_AS_0993]MDQ1153576.1 tRNA dimethylallyltransferase [Brevundimonas sp. SORGH_AS_0993]
MPRPPLITLIAGPTASGKSALALRMARETGAVILNADSQQLYADLRVLTARPSEAEEALADHRLYGVADAVDAWSVGRWSREILTILDDLRQKGRSAILVGGTGLYFTALTKGLADIPAVSLQVRERVEADYRALGEAAFRARLALDDPRAAASIAQGDRQRLVRAMSVLAASGRPLSAWRDETQPLLKPDSWTGLVIEPVRAALYANCDRRVDLMIQGGAVEEVRALLARGLSPDLPAMKAVGVREIAAWLNGETTQAEALAALKQATRNYAKRQLTWFRNQTADWPRRG